MADRTRLALALYCGEGDWLDATIRFATRSRFSHVELVEARPSYELPFEAPAWSASWRDGGVREKVITFRPGHWEFLELSTGLDSIGFIRARAGAPYDLAGVVLCHGIPIGWHSRKAWFCSEIVAASLGLYRPHRHTPGSLAEFFRDGRYRPPDLPKRIEPAKPAPPAGFFFGGHL